MVRNPSSWVIPVPSGVPGVVGGTITVFRCQSDAAELALINSLGDDADGWTFKAASFAGGYAVEVRDGDGVLLGMI